jgi:RNA polymerase sigma-70 factor (ECF subfamily)
MVPDPPQTQELLEQARQGDAAAVERLLAQYRESLRRQISLRLDPALAARLDASDVVQDVLLEAWRRLNTYLQNPTLPFHAWLRHLCRDHVIDAWRRHRQAQRRSLDREQALARPNLADKSSLELAAQLMDHELTPASAAIRQEAQQRLEDALDTLSGEDRRVIWMKHYEHLTNQEMAAELGLTEAASSMRYLRASRRLSALINPGPDRGEER